MILKSVIYDKEIGDKVQIGNSSYMVKKVPFTGELLEIKFKDPHEQNGNFYWLKVRVASDSRVYRGVVSGNHLKVLNPQVGSLYDFCILSRYKVKVDFMYPIQEAKGVL